MRTRCPLGRRVLFCRENPLLENAFLCSRAQASVHLWAGESLGASADDRNRAARCTRRCRPHPPRFARHLPLKGKACGRLIAAPTVHRKPVGAHSMRPPGVRSGSTGRPHGAAPTADTEAVPHFVGNGPKPTRRSQTSRHLLGKARRGCGIASAAILEQPGPSGPD